MLRFLVLLWKYTPTPNYGIGPFSPPLPQKGIMFFLLLGIAAQSFDEDVASGWETNRENLRVDSQWIVAHWPLSALTKHFYPIMKRNKSRKLAGRFSVDRSTVATLSTYKTQMLIDRLSRISPLHVWKYISSWSHQRAPEIVDAACT